MEQLPRHRCLVYEGAPSVHLARVAAAIIQRLQANYRCLYLNSPPMVAGIRSYLAAAGVDVDRVLLESSLVLSWDQTLFADGRFDADSMIDALEAAVIQAVADGYEGLWATGDMSWEFGPRKDFSQLLNYERRLEEVFQKYPSLSGVCQYHKDSLPPEAMQEGMKAHRALFINETLSCLNAESEPAT